MSSKGYKLDISQQKMNPQDYIYTISKTKKEKKMDFLKVYSKNINLVFKHAIQLFWQKI